VPFPDGRRLRIETLDPASARGRETIADSSSPMARTLAIAQATAASALPTGFSLGAGSPAAFGASTPSEAQSSSAIAPKVVVLFPILYRGVPLAKGSDVAAIVAANGRLLTLRRRGLARAVDAVEPRVASGVARETALADFRRIAQGSEAAAGDAELQIWVDAEQGGHLAWHFVVASRALNRPAAIEYYVSAVDGAILSRENAIYTAYHGKATGAAWTASPLQGAGSVNLSSMNVSTPGLGTSVTDSQGNFIFSGGGLFPRLFTGRLSGPFAVVSNNAGPPAIVNQLGISGPNIPINFAAPSDQARAQVSGFYWTNLVRGFATNIIVPGEPRLAGLPVNVNIGGSCNAFWVPDPVHPTSNYYLAGGGCPNMAYSDVVMHEFGHGVDQMNGGIIDGGYSEGFGDALAVLGTRQSCVGRDFFGAQSCLRNATTIVTWPSSTGTDAHNIGHVYSGFTWELVQQLSQSMSSNDAYALARDLIFSAAKLNPSSLPDAVLLSFLADDDDGDPTTCSPHFKQLEAAANSRQLPHPTCTHQIFTKVYAVGDNGSAPPNGVAGYDLLSPADQVLKFDYNGDGKQDLFFYRPGSGAAWVVRSNGDGTFTGVYMVGDNGPAPPNGIAGFDFLSPAGRALAFDYNGDGKDDLFFYIPGAGAAWVARSNGDGTFTGVYTVGDNGPAPPNGIAGFDFLSPAGRALPLDYNGDGKDDLFFYIPGSGAAWVARSNGNGSFTGVYTVGDNGPAPPNGIAGYDLLRQADQVLVFDYDGDGKDDLFLYAPGTGAAWVARSNGTGTFTGVYTVGDNGPAPPNGIAGFDLLGAAGRALAFDYNGDGKDDLFLYIPGAGAAWVARSHGNGTFTGVYTVGDNGPAPPNGIAGFDLLSPADRAIPFDYDGDHKTDIFFYRPGTGAAWVAHSHGD